MVRHVFCLLCSGCGGVGGVLKITITEHKHSCALLGDQHPGVLSSAAGWRVSQEREMAVELSENRETPRVIPSVSVGAGFFFPALQITL